MPQAMILCAGLGTRLRPLTDWLAKPMVPVGDGPAVSHIARRLRDAGMGRLVVNVFHRAADLRAWAEREAAILSEERELLGTAGGVAHAAGLLADGDLVVHNGDILCDLDIAALVRAHGTACAAATLAVVPRAGTEGNVGLGDDGRIVRLRRSTFGDEVASADFLGVHVLGGALRAELPPTGCLVGDVYIPALERGVRLASHVVRDSFIDVGTLDAYLRANRLWLEHRKLAAWVADDADVNATVAGSVIGAGARIGADVLDSVVWPGARVETTTVRSIVTPYGVVGPLATIADQSSAR